MLIKQQLIQQSKYGIKAPNITNKKGVCVHNTANDAPAKNEIAYMAKNNNKVSYHIAIDDVEAIQAIPFNRSAYHAGTSDGNNNYIGVEICYSKSGGPKFVKAEENTAEVVAQILISNNWGIDKVKKHQDFSGKYCPHRTLDLGWNRFLNMVRSKLGQGPSLETERTYLKDGDKGENVKSLQSDLIKLGLNIESYGADGIYGASTKNAVVEFQKVNGLGVDGLAGQEVLNKIKELLNVDNTIYKVQTGAYSEEQNALNKASELKDKGIETYIVKEKR